MNTVEEKINSLSFEELSIQWKVMRSLGYKSLFDPEFRKELRNPLRKMIYYRLAISEINEERKFLGNLLEVISDKLAFFSDPELYKKVKEEFNKNGGVSRSEKNDKKVKYNSEKSRHRFTDIEKSKLKEFLSKS